MQKSIVTPPYEGDISAVLPRSFGMNTYVVKNKLRLKFKGLKTSSVLYRLRKMEKQGLVECVGKNGLGCRWVLKA